ncbi:hypothetical protein BDN72DRAFT_863774 [Pluteus cervinus]|uniref:Uncharacterized protein n=1 Tax=Pluteus cervinus TaxID=181527 RepID=A0ACD3A6N4_9AGAR|nr:hypothetical protein BDN72DRAFT_863774 [Pluteus cervinus]
MSSPPPLISNDLFHAKHTLGILTSNLKDIRRELADCTAHVESVLAHVSNVRRRVNLAMVQSMDLDTQTSRVVQQGEELRLRSAILKSLGEPEDLSDVHSEDLQPASTPRSSDEGIMASDGESTSKRSLEDSEEGADVKRPRWTTDEQLIFLQQYDTYYSHGFSPKVDQ